MEIVATRSIENTKRTNESLSSSVNLYFFFVLCTSQKVISTSFPSMSALNFIPKLCVMARLFLLFASYMLKGYAMEKKGKAEKYRATSYKSLKRKISSLSDILDNAYGKSYCQISNPTHR